MSAVKADTNAKSGEVHDSTRRLALMVTGQISMAAANLKLREMSLFRESDVTCRYGGEEFTLILPDCSLETAERRAEERRFRLSQLRISYQRNPSTRPRQPGATVSWAHRSHPPELTRPKDCGPTPGRRPRYGATLS